MTAPSPSLSVYVHKRGKRRPTRTFDHIDDLALTATFVHDGETYHFAYADLVDGYVTFTEFPPVVLP